MKRLSHVLGILCLAIVPLLYGCGGSGGPKEFKMKGKVHRNGTPLQLTSKVPGGSQIEVGFFATGADGPKDPRFVLADPSTGTFTMEGKGVTAGKYKVSVHQYDPRPEDKLKNAFSKEKTPIVIDVAADGEIDIDLSKYEKK